MIFLALPVWQRAVITCTHRQCAAPVVGDISAIIEFHGNTQIVMAGNRIFSQGGGQLIHAPSPAYFRVLIQNHIHIFLQNSGIALSLAVNTVISSFQWLLAENIASPDIPQIRPTLGCGVANIYTINFRL